MSWPAAEVDINETLVASLLRAQYPDLANLACVKVAEGFDNSLWRLDDEFVVRVPRREVAVATIENELRWLSVVAAHASLRTPLPIRPGVTSEQLPWPWLIASWIDGVAGDDTTAVVRGRSAQAMATFLREIHVEAPTDAPYSPFRSVSLAARETSFLSTLRTLGNDVDHEVVKSLWGSVRDAPSSDRPNVWIHGDFHPGNTLYHDGELVGVIDFGDLCAGDPATDLAGGLLALPYEALGAFFDAYGSCDNATLQRTVGWALCFGVMFASLGRSIRPSYLGVGELALVNAVKLAKSF